MLAAFVPGQTVAVAFETVNNVNWLRRIRRNLG
jgi:hypothetical protein